MLNTLSITLPVFGVIAIGYVATRFKVTSPADIRTLGLFVLKFALPALVFTLLSQRHFAEIWNPVYLAAYGFASLAVFTLMPLTATLLQGRGCFCNSPPGWPKTL